jgi:hypothetical protein
MLTINELSYTLDPLQKKFKTENPTQKITLGNCNCSAK